MIKNKHILVPFLTFTILLLGCREPIALNTESFENLLVVEATITNELKLQEVKLSKTNILEDTGTLIESNAEVTITDSNNNIYTFSQNTTGVYVSDIQFKALPNVMYKLDITTSNGKQYTTTPIQLTPISQINNLYAELVDHTNEGLGVQVFINSDNTANNAQYFRYEYEETYKIVAPNFFPIEEVFSNFTDVFTSGGDYNVFFDVEFRERLQEEKTCFNSKKNTEIIQTSTSNLTSNVVSRFPIRFINQDNSIIRERYSILVKQYVQSLAAYTYYNVLNQLGDNANILSENQPGYIKGNITSINNPTENIIGFFDVASVTESRIFFNYFDFGLPPPQYAYECNIIELDFNDNTILDADKNDREEIYRRLTRFEEENQDYTITEAPIDSSIWKIVNPECGDCTSIASNIQPDFWED